MNRTFVQLKKEISIAYIEEFSFSIDSYMGFLFLDKDGMALVNDNQLDGTQLRHYA